MERLTCQKCGTPLTRFNPGEWCFLCQKNRMSIDELNEKMAQGLQSRRDRTRRYALEIVSPIKLYPDVWDELESKIRTAISKNRLKIKITRL